MIKIIYKYKRGFPITALEDVKVKIQTKFGTLDFTKDAFKVVKFTYYASRIKSSNSIIKFVNDKEIKILKYQFLIDLLER